jgi:hypothetical protein
MLRLPPQLMEIPSLEDEVFMAEVERVEAEIRSIPTDGENYPERAEVARRYYNALQAEGFELQNVGLLFINYTMIIDERYSAMIRGLFDSYYLRLRQLHRWREELGDDAVGWIEIKRPRVHTWTVREHTTIEVVYHVGKVPLPTGARFRFAANWQCDSSPLQFTRDKVAGYTTVHASVPEARFATGMEYWHSVFGSLYPPGAPKPAVTLISGELTEGDTVTFVLGDTSGGGPGLLLPSVTTDAFNFRFEVDPEGSGESWAVVGEPRFRLEGADPHHVRVVAPTTVRPGEEFSVRASVEDRYFNRAVGGPARLELLLDGNAIARSSAIVGDPAIFHFDALSLPADRTGPVTYEVRDREGTIRGRSNPAHVIGSGEPHVFWGDLHTHEGYTDGTGTAEWVVSYARNVAFLDFAALTGHEQQMSELYQRDVQRVTEKYNEPHRFVTFKSYEWTMLYTQGGHHNVFYRDPGRTIIPTYVATNLPELYRIQREVNDPADVLIVPHCHEPGDWNFNDAAMERLVEIYSMHGSFEWFGRRFLNRGYHTGLIAASDDHTGHPGNNPVMKSQRGGLAAVFAETRTRVEIFDGLTARRAYGSSGARIYLTTEVAGAPMGSDVVIDRPHAPAIEISGFVSGTAPLAGITAVLNGEEAHEINLLAGSEAGEPRRAAIRLAVTNDSDPGGPPGVVRPPLDKAFWWGRIMLGETPIAEITPLGIDGPTDSFRQVSDRRIDFSCVVTGDQDGVLIELEEWVPEDTLTVEVFSADRLTGDDERWPQPLWGERALTKVAAHWVSLAELDRGAQLRPIDDRNRLLVERVAAEVTNSREFSFTLTEGVRPDTENHVYVRVRQIDDQVAWSSPVWVGWRE